MQNMDVYKFCMTQHVSLAFLTGQTEVETRPGVSNRLCHGPHDSENKKKILHISSLYSIVLMPTMCHYLIFSFFYKIILEGSG